ncbi:protein BASIC PENTACYSTEINE2-like [Impatiens glandulifera]|uniref:protein BASIC PENTACYSTEINE2-like n=1 Tax=Impatiens glandulifera TaxID=253017 RepID=UPI001FB0B159|nr:protein BASIC PENTACYSTEINE2-like [Impatiens glandulifera]
MDDDGLNMRNWGYYEPSSIKGHLGLQLMSATSVGERNSKPFLTGREHTVMVANNGGFHPRDCVVSEAPPVHMDYVRDSWMSQREKFLNMLPGNHNHNFSLLPEPSITHPMQMIQHQQQQQQQQPETLKDPRIGVGLEDANIGKEVVGIGRSKKRNSNTTPKAPKPKKSKKGSSVPKENGSSSVQRGKPVKKSMDLVINGVNMDISAIPIPVCSCTGSAQQCYRWGCGGWQSACCTTTISTYPLPMSTKRRGARIAGRKMSQGAFKKVLEKMALEGYSFGNPIDLRTHWAKHGTNKFVTIR